MQKYKIQELIGQGSFGYVYLVFNQKGQKFAYKKIKFNPFEVEEAEREIDVMRRFEHPHLVKIYEHHFQEDKELLHIIMEYCEGGDLGHFIQNNKNLPKDQILQILRQIVSAFVVMSANGVIHRDLKPQNVLLSKDKKVKISDFGCAKYVGVTRISQFYNQSMEKGTFLYTSPQKLRMDKYSFKCDVWAAGCIAFLLQYGYHPFAQSNPPNVLCRITQKTHQKPIAIQQGTNPKIATFISYSLIYEDIQRASWRELQLCRIFSPKIANIDKYIDYLRVLSRLANLIVRQFWKVHRVCNFSNQQDEIFIYYLIKFSFNNLKMCLRLMKKSEFLGYLFQYSAFDAFEPKQEVFNQVKKSYLQHQKYFSSIKKKIEAKDCYMKFIAPFESMRSSPFIELDKSIRTGYKILLCIRKDLGNTSYKDNKIWGWIAKWINFEKWFSYEKLPTLQMMNESQEDIISRVQEQLLRYQNGIQ